MEYVNATLSGILLWLFIFYCVRSAQKRARTWGGETLIDVGYPRRTLLKKIGLGIFLIFPIVNYLLMFVIFGRLLNGRGTRPLFVDFMQIVNFVMFAYLSIRFLLLLPLEIRENGIVVLSRFRPWGAFRFCRYSQLSRTLEFHLQGNVGWSVGAMVPAERKEAIVEVVARHVEIRDYSGDVVSRPPTGEGGRESNVVAPSHGKYSPFQFDILTLLFLMIVVAAFAGWYGILFRRSKATAEQKTHFQEKYEAVEYREYGNGITSLDFSKCKKEFTDDDLAEVATCSQLESLYFPLNTSITDAGLARLEGLTSLEYLSVSGNGITDAGLVHLYGLKKLKSLRFYYTRITPQGIEKLQKELPDTEISNTASISNIF